MRNSIFKLLSGVFLLTLITTSNAAAAQLDWTGIGRGAWVTFSLNNNPIGSPFSDFAGEITWNWIGTTPSGFSNSFYSYCVDATRYLTDPQTVTVGSTSSLTGATQQNGLVTPGGGADAGRRIAWLFNTYSAEAHGDMSGVSAAALQIAIWETLYDADHNVDTGSFKLINNASYPNYSLIHDKATNDLNNLYSNPAGGYYTSEAVFLDTTNGQDQVTNHTPEPSTLILLGSGAFVAVWRQRRSSSRRLQQ